MEKEFNLSEKRFKADCFQGYSHEDIKEFIKKVQEVVLRKGRRAKSDIDKLAGEQLTEMKGGKANDN